MSKAKNWVVTDFSDVESVVLNIEGVGDFAVTQMSMSYAKNDIPRCTCLVAIGRDARSQHAATKAAVHRLGMDLKQMKPATITVEPKGEWQPGDTRTWKGKKVIFRGYYMGMAYRKVLDKVQPVLQFIHWLADLTFSSTMCSRIHSSVATMLRLPAVMGVLTGSEQVSFGEDGATTDESGMEEITTLGHTRYADLARLHLENDLWECMKIMLSDLAEDDRFDPAAGFGAVTGCVSGEGWKTNDNAKRALQRIEGKAGNYAAYAKDYLYGKPLRIDAGEFTSLIGDSIGDSLAQRTLSSLMGQSFWDALLTSFLPDYTLAIIPMVERALIVADCPGLRTPWVKTIRPDDYDSFDWQSMLALPVWGIGILCQSGSQSGDVEGNGGEVVPAVGGGFIANSEEVSDGILLVEQAPAWLDWGETGDYADETTGVKDEVASGSMTSDAAEITTTAPKPKALADTSCALLKRYAQAKYVENMLRGRNAQLSGKLRFDIAPGSIVKIEAKPEQFEDGTDALAVTMYAQVNRVTININAEAKLAGTTFGLTHVRTEAENAEGADRTSVAEHPLFGADVYNGAPLIDDAGQDDWLFK